ncbi:DNA double-strand break repair Rad50 ATPase [Trichonephila inaurata madagascariensis]|uniref:DNA double-strand break repair Rad50 ATPase n=1 Tax=Trichonephila inaurata madagascariensis TaxID=2747483 RepID=A0A8X6YGW1_9ARAC|nr:DNA double-strand break repair Rad50 ATPase [Trichonephila inaurata madagascariensis]
MLNLHINGANIDNQLQQFWTNAESNFDEASDGIKVGQKSDSISNLLTRTSNYIIHDLFDHCSSLTKIIHILAYYKRFIKNCKKIDHLKDHRSVHPLIIQLHLPFRKPKPLKKLSFIGFKQLSSRGLNNSSFIAAVRRFSARRGAPRHIYSDNGTNFVGARRKPDEIRKLGFSLPTNEAISYYLSKSSIDWHFIPPSSPHFGDSWELGIRYVKFHLKRVLGETILTFEDLTTLLSQIEGLLNSKTLSCVIDSDMEYISTLKPSYFLTGDVLFFSS